MKCPIDHNLIFAECGAVMWFGAVSRQLLQQVVLELRSNKAKGLPAPLTFGMRI